MATRDYCPDCARMPAGACYKHQGGMTLGFADPLPPVPPELTMQVLATEIPRLQEAALDRERLQGENAELRARVAELERERDRFRNRVFNVERERDVLRSVYDTARALTTRGEYPDEWTAVFDEIEEAVVDAADRMGWDSREPRAPRGAEGE
jgi:DNA gyrase/topoisomerase IV subunit A